MSEPAARRRILYIDDDPATSRLVERHLRRSGYEIHSALSGPAGLAALQAMPFDAVALDHIMPGQDGLETLAAIRLLDAPPPVVFVTGTDEGRIAVAALKSGAADYVIKDVAGEFLTLLQSALDQAVANADLRRAKEAAEREVVVAKERAEAAARAKSRLLASTGHDLKQPLSVISMAIELLEGQVSGTGIRLLERARRATDVLDRALEGLLEAARLESDTFEPRIEPVAIGDVLQEVVDLGASRADEKGLTLRVVACTQTVLTDRDLLRTILANLVGNAVKYTDRGKVLVGCRRRREATEIQVLDTGIGIAPEEIDRIFDEFHRAQSAGREGMGLGLAIVKRAVAVLGQELTVRSTLGHGSMFSLLIPRTPAASRAAV